MNKIIICFFLLGPTCFADLNTLIKPSTLTLSREQFNKQYNKQFRWSGKDRKTAQMKNKKILDHKFSEAVIKFKDDKVESIDVIFWSKADSQKLSSQEYLEKSETLVNKLNTFYTKAARKKNSIGVTKKKGWLWDINNQEVKLITAYTGKKDEWKGEYIRLSLSDTSRSDHVKKKDLKSNIQKDEKSGDTYLKGLPMINQGDKGYCVCATVARILQFYGREMSMHEVADIAGSTAEGGTSISQMVNSIEKVDTKLRIRIKKIKLRSNLAKDYIRKYNVAKSKQAEMKRYAPEYQLRYLYEAGADTLAILKLAKKDRDTDKYLKTIKKYIDKGQPILWSMTTGVHKDHGVPVGKIGGHMRTIIGYNEKEKQIIYSDTWGPGHEIKHWSAAEAFSVTCTLHEMTPR